MSKDGGNFASHLACLEVRSLPGKFIWNKELPCISLPLYLPSSVQLCKPVDYSLPGFSVQARILGWVVIFFSGDIPDSGIEPASLASPVLAGRFFTTALLGKLTGLLVTQFSFPDLENPGVPLCFSLLSQSSGMNWEFRWWRLPWLVVS